MSEGTELPDDLVRWLREARQGSAEAVGQLLEGSRQYLLLVANQELDPELRGKVSPSDVVGETFLDAYRDFGRFRGESKQEWRAWLRSILRNNLANEVRKYRGTEMRDLDREVPPDKVPPEAEPESPSADSPSAPTRAAEQQQAIDHALAQLPEHYQEVIRLHHEEQLSFKQIGQRMGRTADAARRLWGRAIERLGDILEPPDASA